MFSHNRYRRYHLRNGRYLALPMAAFFAFQYFTGELPPLLAVAYLAVLGAWFVLG